MTSPLRILIDLNPILDVLQKRQPFYDASAAVLAGAEVGRLEGYVAAHSIATLFYLVAKDRSVAVARVSINDLLRFLQVAPVDRPVIDEALVMAVSDFEDAVQMAAAAGIGADYVVTRHVSDFRNGPVRPIRPAELTTLI